VEHLLKHAYGLPLPDEPEAVVRVLLLANKYQLQLGPVLEHARGLAFSKEAVQLLADAAHLEVPVAMKMLLQVGDAHCLLQYFCGFQHVRCVPKASIHAHCTWPLLEAAAVSLIGSLLFGHAAQRTCTTDCRLYVPILMSRNGMRPGPVAG
jgi:hypothetical protein